MRKTTGHAEDASRDADARRQGFVTGLLQKTEGTRLAARRQDDGWILAGLGSRSSRAVPMDELKASHTVVRT